MSRSANVASLFVLATYLGAPVAAREGARSAFVVINAPSIASRGPDSIVQVDSQGRSAVLLAASQNLSGLRDIACKPGVVPQIMVSHGDFSAQAAGILIVSRTGRIIHALPSGTPDYPSIAIAYDRAGAFYSASGGTVFRNDRVLATLPYTGIGELAVDSRGMVYLTDPHVGSRVFRIDPGGNVTVFADRSDGLTGPYGLAVDSKDNVFVANNPPSAPGFILKFDSAGNASLFAGGISFQPGLRSLAVDSGDNLYATVWADHQVLKFDDAGSPTIFADADDGLNYPAGIAPGPVFHRRFDAGR